MTPDPINQRLHENPTQAPKWTSGVKTDSGKDLNLVCPKATRAMVTLMDMEAVMGGAASHFGGPSAFAEMMSATFGFMFETSKVEKKQWHERYHFVNDAGHCENGLYALKANYEVAGLDVQALRGFRSIESSLTGHGEAHLFPEGVYISNGPLGSGLPQAQGLAAAESLSEDPRTTVVAISDGGCMEGEARESLAAIPGLAAKGKMGPFVCMLSDNNTKLSGRIDEDSFSMNPTFESLESLGWNVVRVEDGHDLQKVYSAVEDAFRSAEANPTQPVFLWFKTIKGKGVKQTEDSASGGHGFPLKTPEDVPSFLKEIYDGDKLPEPFEKWSDDLIRKNKEKVAGSASSGDVKKEKIQVGVSKAFSDAVSKRKLPIVSISADLQGSTGLAAFRKEFPANSFEVGVAESNMVSMAIGFSKQGYIPVVDTFAQFGVTKGALPLIMSGLSQGPLIGVFSHTGFQDAADGASHQALSYLSMVSSIPHVDVYCLTCSEEAYALVSQTVDSFQKTRQKGETPNSTIFFLGRENFPQHFSENAKYKLLQAQVVSDEIGDHKKSVTIAVAGSMLPYALKAQTSLTEKGVGSVVINTAIMNKPDLKTIGDYVNKTNGFLATLEDHRVDGGMGSYLAHGLLREGTAINQLVSLGVGDHFGRSSYAADHLYQIYGLDDKKLVESILEKLN